MVNRDYGDEDPIDENRLIPIAKVEIELPYGEPFDWNELSGREKAAIEEWQHQVVGWRAKRQNV